MRVILSHLPEARLAGDLLRRGALVWGVLRLLLTFASLLAGGDPVVHLAPGAAFALVLVTGGVRFVGARWRNEPYILANLGVSPAVAVALSMAPAALGESLLALIIPG